jgi:hypothetical protein
LLLTAVFSCCEPDVLYLLCIAVQVMSLRVRPDKGTVNYDPSMVERSGIERAMGIFNAVTTVLFAYGEFVLFVTYVC